jgi:hypothetical protein
MNFDEDLEGLRTTVWERCQMDNHDTDEVMDKFMEFFNKYSNR